MIKLGRVSQKTLGIEVPLKVEDKDTCIAGGNFFRAAVGCQAS